MKISKRVREQAAMICAIAASTPRIAAGSLGVHRYLRGLPHDDTTYGTRLATAREDNDPVLVLVGEAFNEAYHCPESKNDYGTQDWYAQMACAESLLRTGWSP